MRLKTAGLLAIPLVILLGSANPTWARVETVRWTHSGPGNVSSFRVHWGTSSGSYPQLVNAGVPTPANGVYTFSVLVPDSATVYFAVSAHDSSTGLTSSYSNERVRAPSIGGGGGDGGTDGGGSGGGGTGGGGGTDGGSGGGDSVLEPPTPSGPGLGPLPGDSGEPDPGGEDGSDETEEPEAPEEEPLGAPGRPQVVAE